MEKMEKTKHFYHGSSHLLRRDHDLDVLRDLPHALETLFCREEFNPNGRFDVPQVIGVPGGQLNQRRLDEIIALVYQHWDKKQLHLMMLGSNGIRKSKNNRVFLNMIERLVMFFKRCREQGAKVHLIVCTPVPSPDTPELEEMFCDTDNIIGTLLKFPDFRDSLTGIQPSFLNLSSLVPFRDGDGNVELDKEKGTLFQADHIHLNIVGTAKACTKLQIR
jgi:predicted peroxiredoxin